MTSHPNSQPRAPDAPKFGPYIRPFQEPDRLACQRLAARAAATSYARRMSDLHLTEDDPLERTERRLVALVGDQLVGFIDLDRAHISNLYVAPERQRSGIGGALLDAAEERTDGDLTLSVFTVNPDARRLYERRGFVVEETRTTWFRGAMRDVWTMRKKRMRPA